MLFTTNVSHSWFLQSQVPISFGDSPTGDINENIKITVYPQWYKQVSLEWTIPESWIGAKFHVYFWPGGNEAYKRLTTSTISNPYFSDITTREYSKTEEGYYVVEVILPFTNQTIRSRPVSWIYKRRDKIEKIANEIQRREYLLLSKFAGIKSFFFRKKTYGLRCPRCWSERDEKVMEDHCPICYGTSFDGGYYDPIPIFIQFDITATNKQKTYQGITEPNNLNAWTISMPTMTTDDVIIRTGSWSVYKVISSNPTELQTATVRQLLSLTQLSRSDVENKLSERIESTFGPYYLDYFETKFTKQRFPKTLLDGKPENDPKWAQKQDLVTLPMYQV